MSNKLVHSIKLKWTICTHGNLAIVKRNKFLGPFWSCLLNSIANSVYSPRKWAKWAELSVPCLAGSSKTAPTFLIFSIAMDADYPFELISIVHWVSQFFMHNKSIIGGVTHKSMHPHFGPDVLAPPDTLVTGLLPTCLLPPPGPGSSASLPGYIW